MLLRKINSVFKMSFRRKYLLFLTFGLSVYTGLLMRFFPRKARFESESPFKPPDNYRIEPLLIQDIRFAIHLVAKYTPYPNFCRHQAYQAKLLCGYYKIPYQIFVGFKKGNSGKIEGHAWTIAEGEILTGFCNPADYVVQNVYAYGKKEQNVALQALITAGIAAYEPNAVQTLSELLQTPHFDWTKLYQLARFHKIRPLLLKGLLTVQGVEIPILPQLKAVNQQYAMRHLSLVKELTHLLALSRAAGITVVPYKGIWLAQTYYEGIQLREFLDIDIFVSMKDFPVLKKILLEDGYQPEHNLTEKEEQFVLTHFTEVNFNKNNLKINYHVEPHVRTNGVYESDFSLTMADFEANLRQQQFLNQPILALSPEDDFLVTVIHHGRVESWYSLKCIFDIYFMLKKSENQLDWAYVIRQMERLKMQNALYIGLEMIHRLFGIQYPESVAVKLKQPKIQQWAEERLLQLNQSKLKPMSWNIERFKWKTTDGMKEKMILIWRKFVFPKGGDLAFLHLPQFLFFLYLFLRPPRSLWLYVKKIVEQSKINH
jgi:hypothetical protein